MQHGWAAGDGMVATLCIIEISVYFEQLEIKAIIVVLSIIPTNMGRWRNRRMRMRQIWPMAKGWGGGVAYVAAELKDEAAADGGRGGGDGDGCAGDCNVRWIQAVSVDFSFLHFAFISLSLFSRSTFHIDYNVTIRLPNYYGHNRCEASWFFLSLYLYLLPLILFLNLQLYVSGIFTILIQR